MPYLSFAQLQNQGWVIDSTKGMSTPTYTSISFCLTTRLPRPCVQGYGPTLEQARLDAAHQANKWLAAHPATAPVERQIEPDPVVD